MSEMNGTPEMPYRELGTTGEKVSAIGLGGWHLSLKHVSEKLCHQIVRTAIDRGINFMDNSWDYNEGRKRGADGQGAQGRVPGQGIPDDQDRRALEEGSGEAIGREPEAAGGGDDRPGAAPRDSAL